MHVRWKTLFFLGTLLWLLLCATDFLFVDPETRGYYSDTDEFDWLNSVSNEEIDREVAVDYSLLKVEFPEDTYSLGSALLFWNVVAFLSSILTCIVIKTSIRIGWSLHRKFKNRFLVSHLETIADISCPVSNTELLKKSISSKIPVKVCRSTTMQFFDVDDATTTKDEDQQCSNFNLGSTVSLAKSETSSRTERHLEKQCAKMREEMLCLQAASLKENSALSRKLESIAKEKRELSKQLATSHKECRGAKQELEETLVEKTMLLKRLENATREFKVNIKTKKATLLKLEEAHSGMENLRQQVGKIAIEKELMNQKLYNLENEYEKLKEYTGILPSREGFFSYRDGDMKTKEHVIDIQNTDTDYLMDDFEDNKIILEDREVTQSDRDIRKVQMKLLTLEKNLERFKRRSVNESSILTEESESNINTDEASDVQESLYDQEMKSVIEGQSEESASEYPLESYEFSKTECLLRNVGNLTDEQRQKILEPPESSDSEFGISYPIGSNYSACPKEVQRSMLDEYLNAMKSTELTASDDDTQSDNTTASTIDEESIDGDVTKKKYPVSHSPAFQEFFKSLSQDKTKKYDPKVNRVF